LRFFSILLFFISFSYAKSPYEMGQDLYIKKGCYSCHGNKLEGLHQYPHLANRAKGYMSYKLKYFRAKKADTQQQEMMITFAVGLSDEDIDNLTIYMNEYVEDVNEQRYDDSFRTEGDGGS
jgi:cytochrome c553